MKNRAFLVPKKLDVALMNIAAKDFIGHHDFTTFRSTNCQAKSPLKSLDDFTVIERDGFIQFDCSARSFMHNQVRSMVGSLVEIGLGRWPADGIARALAAKDRAACGAVAPAAGLYFMKVDFEEEG
jgi:tRNA pseudouridine38-40 synthase